MDFSQHDHRDCLGDESQGRELGEDENRSKGSVGAIKVSPIATSGRKWGVTRTVLEMRDPALGKSGSS